MSTTTLDAARDAKGPALEVFGRLADVAGIGITRFDDGFGLKVNLTQEPEPGVELPQEVNGVPVRIEVVGRLRKL